MTGSSEFYGAIDLPEKSDHQASHILGIDTTIIIPESSRLDTEEGNQGKSVMCTCYATNLVAKIANEIEHQKKLEPDYLKEWELQGEFGTQTAKGDLVQTAIKNVNKNGLITTDGHVYPIAGYAQINKEDINYWIAQGYAIITSAVVTDFNFVTAKSTGTWGGVKGVVKGGHAFCIVGYEKGRKICSNSYGANWGFFKDGTFRIDDEDIKDIGTCYILYDQKDIESAAFIFKDVTSLSPYQDAIFEMKKLGIMNGYKDNRFRPEQPITRGEFAQVLFNLIKTGYINPPKND